jgi:glycosyltransferase involved in cell wall biosynthesis
MRTVVHFSDSNVFGGTEKVLTHLLAGLDRQRWRPVLFHHAEPSLGPLLAKARELDVELRAVPRINRFRDVAPLSRFVRELRSERPSVFHAHLHWPLACRFGLVAAALAHVRVRVATAHLFVELPTSIWISAQQRLVTAVVGRYLAVSHEVAERMRRRFRIPAHKLQVVPNAIDLTPFGESRPDVLRATLTRKPGQPIVLTVARLDRQKGHSYLLAAAAQVPDALFVLAGDGPERASLEAAARAAGLEHRVIFLGYRSDIPDLLASSDLFVLPSLFEGLPLSILEAMAAGRPVIASAIGGNDEAVVHGGTGLLVPPADPDALAQAIRLLLSDASLARCFGAAGRAHAQREFSARRMVDRVTQVYDELLSPAEAVVGSGG